MPTNPMKMAQLIDRLLDMTNIGQLRWQQSAEPGKFHVRVGEHSIQLAGTPSLAAPNAVAITVLRLDGTVVDDATSGIVNVFATGRSAPLSDAYQERLSKLYDIVSDNSSELDQILRELRIGRPSRSGAP